MTQADALDILKMGNNVYLTGSAGSGKTYVLNAYIKYLREHGIGVAVTASTGIAATHMGGMTIHSWSGIGIKEHLSDYDIDQMETKKHIWDRFEKVSVLIIDEVSMLSGTFLDSLDRLARAMKRNNDLPFGGMQVILSGDLFQLPPISKGERPNFIFNASAWKNMGLAICYLTEQHRQDDADFLGILNAIRENSVTSEHRSLLEERVMEYDEESFERMTKLFTHNADVDAINEQELAKLPDEEEVYVMTSRGKSKLIESLVRSCLAPETLRIREGAQVMFVKNNSDKGYVNGTRGVVTGFDEAGLPIVKTLDGKTINVALETWSIDEEGTVLASISQLPLRHAWAITVHKSQGMSLDAAVIDLSKPFAYGMGYVALSRVRKLSGVHLVGLSENALAVDPQILSLDGQLKQLSDRASARLSEIERSDIVSRQNDFILASGGSLEAVAVKDASDIIKDYARKPTHEESLEMLKEGKTISSIAKERDLTVGTIIGHLEKCLALGMDVPLHTITMNAEDLEAIEEAFDSNGYEKLTPVKKHLDRAGYSFSFDALKLARLLLKNK